MKEEQKIENLKIITLLTYVCDYDINKMVHTLLQPQSNGESFLGLIQNGKNEEVVKALVSMKKN